MINHFEGFTPIHTVFYSVFHPTEGTKVCYEFPPGNLSNYNINFDTIKNYVIPKPQLCHKLLTLKYNNYRLVGYPITINSSLYARNYFSFNFVFVFPYDCETSPYESVVARLGKMFCLLEEQCQILSKSEKDPAYFDFRSVLSSLDQGTMMQNENDPIDNNSRQFGYLFEKYREIQDFIANSTSQLSIQDILMRIYQDLNSYSECLIPIDAGNAIDIKLFPLLMPPTGLTSIEDVPISTVNLSKIIDVNWDPTMLKIVPYIDGLKSIAKIAELSNSDPYLIVECIKHFIYYKCVTLSDIFQFSNIYAPTSSIRDFLTDTTMATECQSYITSPENSSLLNLPFDKKKNEKYDNDPIENNNRARHKSNGDSRTTSFSSSIDSESQKDPQPFQYENMLYKDRHRSESSFSSSNTNEYRVSSRYFPTKATLFDLYRSLRQGITLKVWYEENFIIIRKNNIDVRRFIIFGVTKGLIYRCHSFPVLRNYEKFERLEKLDELRNKKQSKTGKYQKFSSNIFSTSDIKFGEEDSLNSTKKLQKLDMDIADRVLRNVYKKLSINDRNEFHSPQMTSNISEDSSRKVTSEGPVGTQSTGKKIGSVSKVSFEKNNIRAPLSSPDIVRSKEINDPTDKRMQDELLLLESLQLVDNMDKICLKLGKSRKEVEEILDDMVDYKIINS